MKLISSIAVVALAGLRSTRIATGQMVQSRLTAVLAIEWFLAIYEKGMLRYGLPDQKDLVHGAAAWNADHISMRMERDEDYHKKIPNSHDQ
jgi:hypothetical protein